MIKRPVRTSITEPLTRCGVVDEDWKYIVASTILTLIFSAIFVSSFWLMLLLTPTVFATGIIGSVTLHKRRPPRWVHHKAIYLLRRLEALLFNCHPSIRSPLPGIETPLLAQPGTASRAARTARPDASASQARTLDRQGSGFDPLELLPASAAQASEYKEELSY